MKPLLSSAVAFIDGLVLIAHSAFLLGLLVGWQLVPGRTSLDAGFHALLGFHKL